MDQRPKENKICLIYTGGTIGMSRDSNGILHPPPDPNSFLEIAPELKDIADFDFVPLMNKDSTNIDPSDWIMIANAIYERRNNGYDGFVIAHGTDTMHFSASAIALALGENLKFPVVFTGAQTAPDVPHGDARVNLLRAFKVSLTELAEVVICFGENVFRGCRAQKTDERRFNAFGAPAHFPLAFITEDIQVNSDIAFERKEKSNNPDIDLKAAFATGVLQVSLIPGLEPRLLEHLLHDTECKGIILQSFGAGNVPDEYGHSWINFIREAKKRGKPILITSQFPANSTLHTAYAPGCSAVRAGAIPTSNMTSACATVKFRWVLAQIDEKGLQGQEKLDEINKMMNTPFVGELDLK